MLSTSCWLVRRGTSAVQDDRIALLRRVRVCVNLDGLHEFRVGLLVLGLEQRVCVCVVCRGV